MDTHGTTAQDAVTVRQAVEARSWLTERYLRRLIFEHRIPVFRIGGKVLVRVSDLDALVEAGRIDAAS